MTDLSGLQNNIEPGANMHRVYFEVSSTDAWYAIMREARALYGQVWSCQGHVRKKLDRIAYHNSTADNLHYERVWFEVPDPMFSTWISMKLAVRAVDGKNK